MKMIDGLRVYHFKKSSSASGRALDQDAHWSIDTCQRRLVIRYRDDSPFLLSPGEQIFRNAEAYEFLLRFATGLESEVLGEADVFGQLKEAWKNYETAHPDRAPRYLALVQRIFEDTKEIRSNYLQNIGNQSYGGLVRKFLTDETAAKPLSVIGAGQIAQSILPWVSKYELSVWNRSAERLRDFEREASFRNLKLVWSIFGSDREEEAWKRSDQVVVCLPVDATKDAERLVWAKGKRVIHLGGNRAETATWKAALGDQFVCLEDLYEVLSSQGTARAEWVDRARKACHERAKLRALGGSLSIPHGWEDLALFA